MWQNWKESPGTLALCSPWQETIETDNEGLCPEMGRLVDDQPK